MSDKGFWILDFGFWIANAVSDGFRAQDACRRFNPKSKIQNPKSRRLAFTLLEVLIAIALLLALLGAMFGFLFDMLASRARALEHTQQQQAASAMIRQLDTDLLTCIVGDRISGSGVAGDETHLRVLTRGVASKYAERGLDDPDGFGDLQLSEFRFNATELKLEGRRGPARRGAQVQPYEPASGVIHRVRFRYYDGASWRTSFDSLAADRLPVAVEVAVWFRPAANESGGSADAVFTPNDLGGDESESTQENGATTATQARKRERSESALSEDSSMSGLSPPDRIRVFVIPDAARDEVRGASSPGPTTSTEAGGAP